MSLSALGSLLEEAPQYRPLRKSLDRSHASAKVQVLSDAAPFTLATLWREMAAPTLVITPRLDDARRLHEQLAIWSGQEDAVHYFAESETLPFERLDSDVDTTHRRL